MKSAQDRTLRRQHYLYLDEYVLITGLAQSGNSCLLSGGRVVWRKWSFRASTGC